MIVYKARMPCLKMIHRSSVESDTTHDAYFHRLGVMFDLTERWRLWYRYRRFEQYHTSYHKASERGPSIVPIRGDRILILGELYR